MSRYAAPLAAAAAAKLKLFITILTPVIGYTGRSRAKPAVGILAPSSLEVAPSAGG